MTINTQFVSRKRSSRVANPSAIARQNISDSYRYKRTFDIIFFRYGVNRLFSLVLYHRLTDFN